MNSIFTALLAGQTYPAGIHGRALDLFSIIIFLSTSQLAVSLVNWLSTLLAQPQSLPRMGLSKGIPPELRTLVVIPTMLINVQNIKELIEALEVRFLANRDDNLHFSLLTDFQDAATETLPGDEDLVILVRKKIEELNEKYKGLHNNSFFLFHRPRKWNSRERLWMGYERKRGKLEELNSMLRGGLKSSFSHIIGKTEILSTVKYVITLDTDTQLPHYSARQLVGAMVHPLNRAQFNEVKHRVTDGYTILQPG